jgi:peroxiredoxin
MRSDIVPGGAFPDYELPDQTSTPRRLSELQGDDPMILMLARGHYCPKEHQQHLQLAAFYPQVAVAYTQMATISTDDHHTSQEFRASVGAQWPFLEDPERMVQRDLHIQEYTDPEHDPMIPHTLPQAGARHPQRLHGLLVLGPAVVRRASPRPPRGDERDPAGLGPEQARAPRGVRRRRSVALPRFEQAIPQLPYRRGLNRHLRETLAK